MGPNLFGAQNNFSFKFSIASKTLFGRQKRQQKSIDDKIASEQQESQKKTEDGDIQLHR
jgi:hypothetical protein